MKRIIAVALAAIATLALVTEASAKRHRHHRHHHRHHHHRNAPVVAPEPSHSIFSFHQSKGAAMLAEAQRWIGSRNPTGFRGPWCGAFMGMVSQKTGVKPPPGYLMARSWTNAGTRLRGPAIGAIAVMTRRGGGHVGVVSGVDADGDPIVVSGNHNRRVGVAVYPKSRVLAYVEP